MATHCKKWHRASRINCSKVKQVSGAPQLVCQVFIYYRGMWKSFLSLPVELLADWTRPTFWNNCSLEPSHIKYSCWSSIGHCETVHTNKYCSHHTVLPLLPLFVLIHLVKQTLCNITMVTYSKIIHRWYNSIILNTTAIWFLYNMPVHLATHILLHLVWTFSQITALNRQSKYRMACSLHVYGIAHYHSYNNEWSHLVLDPIRMKTI